MVGSYADAALKIAAYLSNAPVYAAADTRSKVEQAIRATLAAYLAAHPDAAPTSAVRVARVSDGSHVQLVGVGALLGTRRSRRKARASQLNGRLGGRPRKTAKTGEGPMTDALARIARAVTS